jgi:hypothetical protein
LTDFQSPSLLLELPFPGAPYRVDADALDACRTIAETKTTRLQQLARPPASRTMATQASAIRFQFDTNVACVFKRVKTLVPHITDVMKIASDVKALFVGTSSEPGMWPLHNVAFMLEVDKPDGSVGYHLCQSCRDAAMKELLARIIQKYGEEV